MKALVLSLALCLFIALAWASDPMGWEWAQAFNVTGNTCEIQGGCADTQGNIYLCGVFSGDLTLGSNTYTATGSGSGFVTKLNSAGDVQWSATCSNTLIARIMDCAADAQGNLYVTGYQYGPTTFGSIISACPELTYRGFVAKLNSGGAWQWARTEFSPDGAESHFIERDAAGSLYVLGFNAANGMIFVAKLNSSGAQTWRTVATGTAGQSNAPRGLVLDHANDIIILCVLHGSITLGNDTLVNEHGYNNDFILAKLNNAGSWQWARDCAYTNTVEANGVAVDSQNNVLIAGVNIGYPTAGSVTMGDFTLSTSLTYDMMVFKLSPAGEVIGGWDNATGTMVGPQLKKMISDGADNFYCFGLAGATGSSLGYIGIANIGMFIAKMDAGANWQEVKLQALNTFGSTILIADGEGHLIVGGNFGGSGPFGGTTLSVITQYGDLYAAKTANIGPVANEDNTAPAVTPALRVWPNPARGPVTVEFSAKAGTRAEMEIYNLRGQKVRSLSQQLRLEGVNTFFWDGRDDRDNVVPSGIYFARIKAGNTWLTTRFALIK